MLTILDLRKLADKPNSTHEKPKKMLPIWINFVGPNLSKKSPDGKLTREENTTPTIKIK